MTTLLNKAVDAVCDLPVEAQDFIARVVLDIVDEARGVPVALTGAEREAIAVSKLEVARGDFATDEEVRAIWAEHGLCTSDRCLFALCAALSLTCEASLLTSRPARPMA